MLGDRPAPGLADIPALGYVMRCVNESMRLYPHPPVLLRRAQAPDVLPGAPAWNACCRHRGPAKMYGHSVCVSGVPGRQRAASGDSGRRACMLGYRVRAARGTGPRPAAARTGGYSVPVGQDVMISVYNIHRSPAVWADPHAFRPERFPLDQPVPTEQNTDYRRAPVAHGVQRAASRPRSCPEGGWAGARSAAALPWAAPRHRAR